VLQIVCIGEIVYGFIYSIWSKLIAIPNTANGLTVVDLKKLTKQYSHLEFDYNGHNLSMNDDMPNEAPN